MISFSSMCHYTIRSSEPQLQWVLITQVGFSEVPNPLAGYPRGPLQLPVSRIPVLCLDLPGVLLEAPDPGLLDALPPRTQNQSPPPPPGRRSPAEKSGYRYPQLKPGPVHVLSLVCRLLGNPTSVRPRGESIALDV